MTRGRRLSRARRTPRPSSLERMTASRHDHGRTTCPGGSAGSAARRSLLRSVARSADARSLSRRSGLPLARLRRTPPLRSHRVRPPPSRRTPPFAPPVPPPPRRSRRSFTTVIDLAVAVKCFGVATSYLIVVGDSMPKVAPALMENPPAILLERSVWIVAAMALVGPLAFLKQARKGRKGKERKRKGKGKGSSSRRVLHRCRVFVSFRRCLAPRRSARRGEI